MSSKVLILVSFVGGLVGCGSPLLDHSTVQKPVAERSSENTSALNAIDEFPEVCTHQFLNSKLCFEIQFHRTPRFQASLQDFSADLLIWNPETQVGLDSALEVSVFHSHPDECCIPPDIRVSEKSPGKFLLEGVEFHAFGDFDFIVEIADANLSTEKLFGRTKIAVKK